MPHRRGTLRDLENLEAGVYFLLLADGEPVGVNPCTIDAFECGCNGCKVVERALKRYRSV
jgi:hypothetical protein